MAMSDASSKLCSWFAASFLLAATAAPAAASTILVREELGLSFFPSGIQWQLEEDGPSVVYDLSAAFGAGALFDLRFTNGSFVMTALGDNTVASNGLAFGLDVYPGDVTPVSPAFDCLLTTPCYNGIAFLPWFIFPTAAGEFLSQAIPPGAIDEPVTWMLLAMAFVLMAWTRVGRRVLPVGRYASRGSTRLSA